MCSGSCLTCVDFCVAFIIADNCLKKIFCNIWFQVVLSLHWPVLSLLCCLFPPRSTWPCSVAFQFSLVIFSRFFISSSYGFCYMYWLAIAMTIMLPNKPPLNSVAYNSKNLFSCWPVCRFSVFSLSRLGLAERLARLQDRFRSALHVFLQLKLKEQWLLGHVLIVDHQSTRQIIQDILKTLAPKYANITLAKATTWLNVHINYTHSPKARQNYVAKSVNV